ncbi:MAG TPA: chromosome segregation protein SMC [Verrucomicrobia bacterium]|nr:chromosome segregation protein SMC [Verrucomicrobiota bacterium]
MLRSSCCQTDHSCNLEKIHCHVRHCLCYSLVYILEEIFLYLKSIELVGFKSFAQKTKLEFKPGMTAIVGPNGCGKSNVSDAVRWVLGEQRARALRGAKMEDVIFNGTDNAKPLGMAEVSITLADCASTLGVDYDEVCIARRVFRSGESGYFLNRKACRLKDIQRLFMDTGVGTDSYSVLEQGKIDQILSARPEDRRAVFEEASGITKYKSDKKEALRKLEHTDANLLRLDDVIREVKRQIISLQRQAGKARRYKELSSEIRSLDIFASNQHLADLESNLIKLNNQISTLEETSEDLHQQIEATETKASHARQALAERENHINKALEEASQARSNLSQANQLIMINRDRIKELDSLAERNNRETNEAKDRLEYHQHELVNMKQAESNLLSAVSEAKKELEEALTFQKELEDQMQLIRNDLSEKRTASVDLDSTITRLQNDLNSFDARDRERMLKRERLSTEKAELSRSTTNFQERATQMQATLAEQKLILEKQIQQHKSLLQSHSKNEEEKAKWFQQKTDLHQKIAAKQAQLELLSEKETRHSGFPAGTQELLKTEETSAWLSPDQIIGPLVEKIDIDPKWQAALEASLRSVIDTLIVKDQATACLIFNKMKSESLGSIRLLHADIASPTDPIHDVTDSLIQYIQCPDSLRPLLQHLIGNINVIEDLDRLPDPLPSSKRYVTSEGILFSQQASEWLIEEDEGRSLLARHHLRIRVSEELSSLEADLHQTETLYSKSQKLLEKGNDPIASLHSEIDQMKQALAIHQGELQVILRETEASDNRTKTVSFELQQLEDHAVSGNSSRQTLAEQIQTHRNQQDHLRSAIQELTKKMNQHEEDRSQRFEDSAEKRLHSAHCIQQQEQHDARKQPLQARIKELNELIDERSNGVNSYRKRIEELEQQSERAENQIITLQNTVENGEVRLQEERTRRDVYLNTITTAESSLRIQYQELETLLKQKSKMDVEKAENLMRQDNLIERLTVSYQITPEELSEEPLPEWDQDEVPSRDFIETRVAEIQAKLDLMGPVNLVAIEEHAEHEERYAFLMKEQNDLTAAKKQLLEMIKNINNTTTELFEKTFHQVNKEFQEMFKQLFGGGSAKLVLTDEEDILEAGIEIIARPPGKKLQSISLLSGGERTMTAVALLFSLFKVKPSPFCVMDELDAALDDANINRFVSSLKGFLTQSQFVLITHSRQTIAAADVIYGVTMETQGISKLVSMQFADYEKKETLKSS